MVLDIERRPSFKACPWWARFATTPSGWVIAHCSYSASLHEKRNGRVWEGPPKGECCTLGYTGAIARDVPAIIFYYPQANLRFAVPVSDRRITDRAWNCIVEWIGREMVVKKDIFDWQNEISSKVRELIKQAWSA